MGAALGRHSALAQGAFPAIGLLFQSVPSGGADHTAHVPAAASPGPAFGWAIALNVTYVAVEAGFGSRARRQD